MGTWAEGPIWASARSRAFAGSVWLATARSVLSGPGMNGSSPTLRSQRQPPCSSFLTPYWGQGWRPDRLGPAVVDPNRLTLGPAVHSGGWPSSNRSLTASQHHQRTPRGVGERCALSLMSHPCSKALARVCRSPPPRSASSPRIDQAAAQTARMAGGRGIGRPWGCARLRRSRPSGIMHACTPMPVPADFLVCPLSSFPAHPTTPQQPTGNL